MTTRLFRFFSDARDYVFPQVEYCDEATQYLGFGFPKMGQSRERRILDKLFEHPPLLEQMLKGGPDPILVHRIAHYYIKCFNFVPYFRSDRDGVKKSEDYKEYRFRPPQEAFVSLINSSLFYFYWQVFFDGFKAGKACVEGFPCKPFSAEVSRALSKICSRLMNDLQSHATRLKANYATTGKVEYDQFYPRHSKPLMDEIDRQLASHFGLTDEEVDFVLNYDVKFRMGEDGTNGDD